MFMNMLRHPPSCGLSTMCEPNGHNASIPKRIVAMPKGMPMMVINSNSEEMKYSTAMPNPPKMSQTMFPNIFISEIFVSIDKSFYFAKVMKFMENKEYEVIIIRRTTNCQNEDSVFSSTPTPSTGRPFPRKPMFHHTKENMQIFLTIKFNFVLLPIVYWLVSTIDRQEQNLHRH